MGSLTRQVVGLSKSSPSMGKGSDVEGFSAGNNTSTAYSTETRTVAEQAYHITSTTTRQ